MRAAVAEQLAAPLVLKDLPVPQAGPGEVILNVKACGVCYTDLRIIDVLGRATLPLVPGHEAVGIVSQVGAGVTGVAVGDRVAAHALFSCGTCDYCRRGEEEACVQGVMRLAGLGFDGGYAEYMRLPADHAVPLPESLSFAAAAPFCCAGLTTYAGLKNGNLQPGQRVAVVGIGGLGHLAIPIARAMGAEVFAVTSSPDKTAFAKDLGAAFAGDAATMAETLAKRGGAQLVLQTANSLAPLGQLLPGMARQGTIVLTAADGDTLPVPPGMFTALQLRVVGSFFGSRQDLREVLALAAEHEIRPIIERFPLDDVNAAHARLRLNQVRYRAVLEP
jgi:propanol-preferring alcohol dehydrogenase